MGLRGKSARSPAGPASTASVFLNVPFDEAYEPCFLALIAGLVGVGFAPRSVLQVPPSDDRLRRIYGLIRSCRYSLHDLSRVELSDGFPRFNMPFEAGLASAVALSSARHERFLLEAQRHRLLRTCSDLNGTDAEIHEGTSEGTLRAVLNLFGRREPTPLEHLRLMTAALQGAASRIKATAGGDGVYTAAAFDNLVFAAQVADLELRPRARAGRRRKP